MTVKMNDKSEKVMTKKTKKKCKEINEVDKHIHKVISFEHENTFEKLEVGYLEEENVEEEKVPGIQQRQRTLQLLTKMQDMSIAPVSYTHLTLPTILRV